jgi:hypothetical protein
MIVSLFIEMYEIKIRSHYNIMELPNPYDQIVYLLRSSFVDEAYTHWRVDIKELVYQISALRRKNRGISLMKPCYYCSICWL